MTFVRGGVARNVAENMALLGARPFLISVIGDDVAGKSLNFDELLCIPKGAHSLNVGNLFNFYHVFIFIFDVLLFGSFDFSA